MLLFFAGVFTAGRKKVAAREITHTLPAFRPNKSRARVTVPFFFSLWRRAGLAALALVIGIACHKREVPGQNAADQLTFLTSDGVQLAATLYTVATPKAPGLIFVHAMGDDRQTWRPLTERAWREGFECLAFDVRGHGASIHQGAETLDYRKFTDAAWQSAVQDIAAAKRALVEQGVDAANIGVVGAGIGASLAARYAASDPDIAAIVLLSPGLEEHGFGVVNDIVTYGQRPVLLMSAQDDSYSTASCATLKQRAPGFCELRTYTGAARGTDLLAASPNAVEQAVQWLIPILKSSKTPARAP